MHLKKLFLEVLKEQESEDVLEFPNENFTVSLDRERQRLIFAPQQHASLPSRLRNMLNMLKQRFNVSKVNSLEDEDDVGPNDIDDPNLRGIFEIVLDPRENFDAVIEFIQNHAS